MKINKNILTYMIASVWLVNGMFCKIIDLVPRHRLIVARILGDEYATPLTILIGLLETFVAIWIVIGLKRRLNAVIQILLVALMNCLEFFLAPDLLLWGRLNALFAGMFMLIIYFNEFHLNKKIVRPNHLI